MEGELFEIIILELDYYLIQKVRELRIKHQPYLSMLELSQQLNLPDSTVSKAENIKDRFKYNTRALNKIAIFFKLTSYTELFPQFVFQHDLVRMRLRKNLAQKGKHKINADGGVDDSYHIISIEPLTEREIELWHARKIPYLTTYKKAK